MSQPYDDRYPAQPAGYGGWPPSAPVPPGAWLPPWPPGYPVPPPPRRNRAAVAWTVAGCVLAAAVLLTIAVGGYRLGRSEFATMPAAETSPPADWAVIGDDEGLDPYAQRCHDGEMRACDELYTLADPGSDYEYYALTCGGRVQPRDVQSCRALD